MTIVKFLVARLDEDEAAARAAHVETTLPAVWAALFEVSGHSGASVRAATDHIARHDPARVLAQVAAMRAIVDAYEEAERLHSSNLEKFSALASAPAHSYDAAELTRIKTHGWELSGRRLALRHSVRHLAAIWREHAEYDPAWAPD